ncbi:MAG TPA: pilus assembly protein N-terminal domain-containing protein [Terracidiphilus sp.]|nr:pilus assembly protein N-terminal domain-containing protein [Terracidiphilus sp.]
MNARAGIIFAGFGALTFIACATAGHAQAAAEAQQAGAAAARQATPAAQAPPAPGAASPLPQPPLQPVGPSGQDSSNDLSVTVGKAVVLDLAKPIRQIVVGLGDFAEAEAVSPTQVLVNGKSPGETTLIIWDSTGSRQFFNVTVRPSTYATHDELEAIRRQLRAELPGQDVSAMIDSGNVYLRGTVDDLTSSNRAALIAATGGKVVNLLNVKVPPAEKQILLKVRFASVDRTKEKQLGINIFSTGLGNTIGTVTTGQFTPPGVTPGSPATVAINNELNLFAFYPGINLGATIQALEQTGLVQSLAEPNILAEDGKLASFLAGGQFPFPTVSGGSGIGGSAVTISFKEFGIRLSFIPTITPRGTIRLQVAPEVSALDFADAITISGFSEPAITIRRVKTEVELADRQSFAIGGLLDNTDNETYNKIPFLGDIPVLGKFFQSVSRTKANTELIVIVTPEIVDPVAAGADIAPPKFPQSFLPTNSNTPMHTPDTNIAPASAPATIPVEKLIESLKPETPLNTDSGGGGGGGGGGSGGSGTP